MKVYCYPKCSTCKKALAWLDENGAEYELFDIKTQNPDSQQIRSWYEMSGLPLKKFFNTSGMIYREMELSKKLPNMSEEEQIVLLASDGMLVKRPLVIGENYVLTGFKEAEWAEKILK
ncbi:arsenate reductase family protein [Anaerovoracaceae bacterium 41-7]|uniref:arsenate reductase family protein n=1 Tax=Senimuribacter intestinalis TaxID=2941507 RepID=UPI00203EFF55|nr:arsenate reductase family protein [Senimuribacter intestinalis]